MSVNMAVHTQNTFVDGMDFIAPDFQISRAGYKMLINARQRLGYIEPNNKARQVTTIPDGVKQGSISVGDVLIVFIDGKAWYNVDGSDIWIKIGAFTMS